MYVCMYCKLKCVHECVKPSRFIGISPLNVCMYCKQCRKHVMLHAHLHPCLCTHSLLALKVWRH